MSHVPISWSQHKDAATMIRTVDMVEASSPDMILIENVIGFGQKAPDAAEGDSSPLNWFLSRCHSLGYSSVTSEVDLAWWHNVTRKRCFIDKKPC